jgi:integrase
LPPLGDVLVADLTTARLSDWLRKLATAPARVRRKAGAKKLALRAPSNREGASNARRATANRILTVLKAALNLAYREGRVPSDDAWRRVKPYQDADSARIRFLDDEECKRLVSACEPDFRALVTAAILTGCRYSELCLLQAGDVILAQSQLVVRDAKGRRGKSRLVSLTSEARGLFADLVAGKARGAIVFTRADGLPWGANWQVRPLLVACEAANIVPPISFHILRHTHGSRLARMGTEIRIIAEQLGHKDTRITLKHYAHLMPEFVGDRFREKFGDMGLVE